MCFELKGKSSDSKFGPLLIIAMCLCLLEKLKDFAWKAFAWKM